MQASNIPSKFGIVFASGAAGGYIRSIPNTTGDPDAASLTLGFPPATFVQVGAGGVAPNGEDFNGILNQLSAWAQWQAAGGSVKYDGTFQTAIGGYPEGAIVESAITSGLFWRSTADNNTTNPDSAGAGWSNAFGVFPGAETTENVGSTTDMGAAGSFMVLANGASATITSFGSSASTAYPLYVIRWNGANTLVNSSALALPTNANITTANGDACLAEYAGSGNWRVLAYFPKNGQPLSLASVVSGGSATYASLTVDNYGRVTAFSSGTPPTSSPFSASFTSSGQAIAYSTGISVAHGLGATPSLVRVVLHCTTADQGYGIGEEAEFPGYTQHNVVEGATISADGTNIYITIGSSPIQVQNKSTYAATSITNSSWEFIIRAWK